MDASPSTPPNSYRCGCGLVRGAGPPARHHHERHPPRPCGVRDPPAPGELTPLGDDQTGEHGDQAVIAPATWAYVGAGHATEGETWLAPSAAARARERRRIACEELFTITPTAA